LDKESFVEKQTFDNLDPTKSTDIEVERLFEIICEKLLKLEDYDEETYRYLYKIFKEFHQEIIHNHTIIQARTAFANLLAEETNLNKEEIQIYLYQLQEKIYQFR